MNDTYFATKKKTIEEEQIQIKRKENIISVIRMLVFICCAGFFFIFFWQRNLVFIILFLLFLGIFLYFIYLHHKVHLKYCYQNYLLQVIKDYKFRQNGDWTSFSDDGVYLAKGNTVASDLDIVGENSLFKYLNICQTKEGKERLYNALSNNELEEVEWKYRQSAVAEIAANLDFSLDLGASLKEFREKSVTKSLRNNYILEKEVFFSSIIFFISLIISLFTITSLILYLCGIMNVYYFVTSGIIQLTLAIFIHIRNIDVFKNIGDYALSYTPTKALINTMSKTKFSSYLLNKHQQNIQSFGISGYNEIIKIHNLASFCNNIITYLVLNFLSPLNYFLIYLFKKHQVKYKNEIEKFIDSFEDIEVLGSLGTIGVVKENKYMPEFSSEIKIEFENLLHPLISEDKCIGNDFKTGSGVNIITGSNMSGKTSFMRTIGLNLILLNAGSFVNAKYFRAPYLKIFTSMRITDDISRGISTFYAELLRVKDVLNYQKEQKPMIVFIDEIFRGTNANDRIKGAVSLIDKLNKSNVITFITTHDSELCNLIWDNIYNYHFAESYVKEEIKFDYKIKRGKCQTTNAEYLMRLTGIFDK